MLVLVENLLAVFFSTSTGCIPGQIRNVISFKNGTTVWMEWEPPAFEGRINVYEIIYTVDNKNKITTSSEQPNISLTNLIDGSRLWIEISPISHCQVKGEKYQLEIDVTGKHS